MAMKICVLTLLLVFICQVAGQDDGAESNPTDQTNVNNDLGPVVAPPPVLDTLLNNPNLLSSFILPPAARLKIREKCRGRKCKGQQPGTQTRRREFKELRSRTLQRGRGFNRRRGKSKDEADSLVEEHFQKTFNVKMKFYDLYGISDEADADDNGVFDGDMILNDDQLNSLARFADELKQAVTTLASNSELARRRRSSLFFENATLQINYWSKFPIPYMFDTSNPFTNDQKNKIRSALSEITSKTMQIITFQEITSPINGPYIEYWRSPSSNMCGSSTVGQQPFENTVYLSPDCAGFYGSAIHETMHVLGVAHHHTRLDRNDWITINYNNVGSQCLDLLAINDINQFTSYGTSYSYNSIMHYSGQYCAINSNTPTLIPRKAIPSGVVMGQRTTMDATDVAILLRIYCCRGSTTPGNCACRDRSINCGYYTNVGYCGSSQYGAWMNLNCQKSCTFCKCPQPVSG